MHILNASLSCNFEYIGLTAYAEALRIMEDALASPIAGQARVWGLEHPLVYTSGLKTDTAHILSSRILVLPARRGGSVTLHNPGQLVIYFAFPLTTVNGGLERFVRMLEASLAEVLLDYGVDCNLRSGASGIFAPRGKVAFIGLGLKRGYIYHGVSVNLSNNLEDFRSIQSCGLTLPMTRVADLVAEAPTPQTFFEAFQKNLANKLGSMNPTEFRVTAIQGYDLNDWRLGFKRGWLAFHERRFWEAHELWELYWHEMLPGDLRIFFHAMIQVAMAYYKLFTVPNLAGALSLLTKAIDKLSVVREIQMLDKQNDFFAHLQIEQGRLLVQQSESAKIQGFEPQFPPVHAWTEGA